MAKVLPEIRNNKVWMGLSTSRDSAVHSVAEEYVREST